MQLTLIQAQEKLSIARKALASAKSDSARTKVLADFGAASLALEEVQSRLSAKTERHIKHEVHETSDDEPKKPLEEEEDEEEEEESEEEESEDDDDDSDDDDDDDDDDEKAAKSEEEEEAKEERCKEEAVASAERLLASAKASKNKDAIAAARDTVKAIKALSGSTASAARAALRTTAASLTGKKSAKGIAGALQALAGKNAALEAAHKKERVKALLDQARRDGKITAQEIGHLKSQDYKWLKAYLGALPKKVRTVDEGAAQGRALGGGKDGDRASTGASVAQHLDAQNLSAEQRKIVEQQAISAGKSVDDFLKDINATLAKRAAAGVSGN